MINAKTNKIISTIQDGDSPSGVAFSRPTGDPYAIDIDIAEGYAPIPHP